MKISELIKKLEILKEKHGDNELSFSVKDWYSIYGEEMNFDFIVGDDPRYSENWFSGMLSRDGHTTLKFDLKSKEGKNAKITFRK